MNETSIERKLKNEFRKTVIKLLVAILVQILNSNAYTGIAYDWQDETTSHRKIIDKARKDWS